MAGLRGLQRGMGADKAWRYDKIALAIIIAESNKTTHMYEKVYATTKEEDGRKHILDKNKAIDQSKLNPRN